MNSRFAFLLKKSFHVGWILSAPSVRSDVNYGFGESAGCVLQGHTLLKWCYTINVLKNDLLRKLLFGTISEIMCNLYTVGLQLYLNKLQPKRFLENF